MTDILVRGRYLICDVGDNGEVNQIDDGAVLIRGDTIAAVGTFEELKPQADGAEVAGGSDFLIFPGLTDAHHHVGLTPIQLGSPDLPLELWFGDRIGARAVDLYLDTLYSAFELIRSGVTTVQHLHVRFPGGRAEIVGAAKNIIRAYQDLGMRASYSYGLRDQNRLVYEADETFVSRLPEEIADFMGPFLKSMTIPLEENFEIFDELSHAYAQDPLVSIQLAPVNLHWCSDEALERVADVSSRLSVPIHMHLLETPYQKVYARRRTGGTAVEHLERMGLLGPLMTLGHGVWMTEPDLDVIAATDTRVCTNCSSNMRLKSGTAPVNAMLDRGIKVALGIDEATINDDRDMLQEMRLVLKAHRTPGFDSRVPTSAEVFKMASECGALTTPFGHRTGAIRPGYAADIVLAKWSGMAYPFLDPRVTPIDALLHRARSDAIDTVYIAGKPVLKDGRFTTVDEVAAIEELAELLRKPPTEDEKLRREMARRVMPYVKAIYDDYLPGEIHEPYDARNSRT